MIQINGMAAMSVVKYVVTPSMRLTGAADKPIQRKRRVRVNLSETGSVLLLDHEGVARRLAEDSVRCRPKRFVAVMAVAGTIEAAATATAAGATSGADSPRLSLPWRQTMN